MRGAWKRWYLWYDRVGRGTEAPNWFIRWKSAILLDDWPVRERWTPRRRPQRRDATETPDECVLIVHIPRLNYSYGYGPSDPIRERETDISVDYFIMVARTHSLLLPRQYTHSYVCVCEMIWLITAIQQSTNRPRRQFVSCYCSPSSRRWIDDALRPYSLIAIASVPNFRPVSLFPSGSVIAAELILINHIGPCRILR